MSDADHFQTTLRWPGTTYHDNEFTVEQNYWSQRGMIAGQRQGQLAGQFKLTVTVSAEDFAKRSTLIRNYGDLFGGWSQAAAASAFLESLDNKGFEILASKGPLKGRSNLLIMLWEV